MRAVEQVFTADEGAFVQGEVDGYAGEGGECVVVDDGFEEGEGLGCALAGTVGAAFGSGVLIFWEGWVFVT